AEGLYTITVTATNTDNLSGRASYQLLVRTNHEPTVSVTSQTVIAGRSFVYAVPASDDDHDVLTYSLTDAPAGMSIDRNGQITWPTSPGNVGTSPSGVPATDPFGATNQPHPANFTPSVVADAPPTVELKILPSATVNIYATVTFYVLASDDVGV